MTEVKMRLEFRKRRGVITAIVMPVGAPEYAVAAINARIAETFPVHYQHWVTLITTIVRAALREKQKGRKG